MKNYKKMSNFRIFLSYFKPHLNIFILDLFCALIMSLIDLAFPYVTRLSLYNFIPNGQWHIFWTLMGIFFLLFTLRAFLSYIITVIGHKFGILVEADIREDLFKHMQELSFDYYDNNRTGKLMSRLTSDLFDITELAHHGPEDLFISFVTIVGAIIIMFNINWKLALVLMILIPIFIIVVWVCKRNMKIASIKLKQTTANINADIESGISGIRTTKAFANEKVELNKFIKSNDLFRKSKVGYYKAMGMFNASMEFFLTVISLSVVAIGGFLIMRNELNVVDMITFNLYVATFTTPIRKLSNFAEMFANGSAGLTRFCEVMRTDSNLKDKEGAIELKDVKGNIDIENVNFQYKENQNILTNINLHIKQGETIALVGSSGGGKTTLSQLIMRFYDVTSGAIKIDNIDIRDIKQLSLRKNVGVVQQDVFLFADSIYENIHYGNVEATREEVYDAAKKAMIYDDIMKMPDKFETNVGERGVMLSGGQKQRISIARIFLKNPKILIFDEATSALDSITESEIQKTFDKLSSGRTTIVIAHRLSTVKNADRIVVIEKGQIKEEGTHEELMKEKGEYFSLVETQNLLK